MKKSFKLVLMLLALLAPLFVFGAEDETQFIAPFKEMVITWMQGDVGLTIAIVIMVISVVWGAAGGGFPVIGKGFLLSIIVGGVIFFAEKAFNLGFGFGTTTTSIEYKYDVNKLNIAIS